MNKPVKVRSTQQSSRVRLVLTTEAPFQRTCNAVASAQDSSHDDTSQVETRMMFARTSSDPDAVPLANDHPGVVTVVRSVQDVLWAVRILVYFRLVFDGSIAKLIALTESCIWSAGLDYLKPSTPAASRFVDGDSTHDFVTAHGILCFQGKGPDLPSLGISDLLKVHVPCSLGTWVLY